MGPLFNEIERLALEGPIQGNIDLVKDLSADASALTADIIKEEQFYGDAFTKPLFSRPDVRTVSGFDVALASIPLLIGASAANKKYLRLAALLEFRPVVLRSRHAVASYGHLVRCDL